MSKSKIFLLFVLIIYSTIKIIEANSTSIQIQSPSIEDNLTLIATSSHPLTIQAIYNSQSYQESDVKMICMIKKRVQKSNRSIQGTKWKTIKKYKNIGKSIQYDWDGTNRALNLINDGKLCKIVIKAVLPDHSEKVVKKYTIQTEEDIEEPTDEPEVENEPETVDNNYPMITITSHENNSFTKDTTVTIQGNILEENLLEATVNSTNINVNTDGSFEVNVNISEGNNLLEIVAIDLAGNQTTQSIMIKLDTTEPAVNLTTSEISENEWQIKVDFDENGSGIDTNSFSIIVDQTDYTNQCSMNQNSATFTFDPSDLGGGHHQSFVNISDNVNNTTYTNIPFILQVIPAPEEVEESGYIDGYVINATSQEPILNAEISVDSTDTSVDSSGTIYTDENGFFAFPIPADGDYIVHIKKENYTEAVRNTAALKNRDVGLGNIALTSLDSSVTTIDTTGGQHISSDGSIIIDFPEGAVPEGTQIQVSATNYPDKDSLPGPLPTSSIFTYCIELKPDYQFQIPVTVRLKNTRGFAEGLEIPVAYLDRETGHWLHHATATVLSGKEWIEFDTTHFSPHDINLPPKVNVNPDGDDETEEDDDCDKDDCNCEATDSSGSKVGVASGKLELEYLLPSITHGDKKYSLKLEYNSLTAQPSTVLAFKKNKFNTSEIVMPLSHTFFVDIEGKVTDKKVFIATNEEAFYKYLFDGKNEQGDTLETGVYLYTYYLSNDYYGEFATADKFGGKPINGTNIFTDYPNPYYYQSKGKIKINNQINSPFGAGWTVKDLKRLNFNSSDHSVLLIDGKNSTIYNNQKSIYILTSEPKIKVIDPTTDTLAGEISLDTVPYDIAFLSNGLKAYCSLGTSNKIAVINTLTHTVEETIQLNQSANGIDIMPNDQKIYCTSKNAYAVNVIDVQTHHVIKTINFDQYEQATDVVISPDGSKAYVTTSNRTIQVIDTQTDTIVNEISNVGLIAPYTNIYPERIELTPDGKKAYCLSWNGYIFIVNLVNEVREDYLFDVGFNEFKIDSNTLKAYVENGYYINVFDAINDTVMQTIVNSDINSSEKNKGLTIFPGLNKMYSSSMPSSNTGSVDVKVYDLYTGNEIKQIDLNLNDKYSQMDSFTMQSVPEQNQIFISKNKSTIELQNDGTYIHQQLNGNRDIFNSDGLLVKTIEADGQQKEFSYNENNQLVQILINGEVFWEFNYLNEKINSVTDKAGRTTQFLIDNDNNLVSITNPELKTRSYIYDENHLAVSKTIETGAKFEYEYDSYGRIKSVSAPERDVFDVSSATVSRLVEQRQYSPSAVKGLINDLDPNSATTESPAENILSNSMTNEISGVSCGCSSIRSTTNKYGAYLTKDDGVGNIITYERSSENQITKRINPNGDYVTYTYDQNGNKTQKQYYSSSDILLKSESWTYELTFNQIKTYTDAEGNITTYYYEYEESELGDLNNDGITDRITNNLIRIEYPQVELNSVLTTPVELFTYDETGIKLSEKDRNGNITTYEYNESGFMTQMTQGYGSSTPSNTSYSQFDSAGNPGQITNPNDHTQYLTYNFKNQITSMTETVQGETYKTELSYDAEGNLIQKIDKNMTSGNFITTNYQYNELNQLVQTSTIKDGIKSIQNLYYNIHRKLAAVEDSLGNITKYHYDDALQLVKQVDVQGYETTYEYNSNGLLSKTIGPDNIEMIYNYDDLNQKITETLDINQLDLSNQYTYTPNGELSTSTDPKGLSTLQNYDALGRLTQTIDPSGNTTNYQYDLNGNLLQITDANGNNTSYIYDSINRLSDVTYADSTTENYVYDNNGNIKQFTDRNGQSISFDWDERNRLIQKNYADANTATFNYDYLNNLITASETRYGSSIVNTYLHKNLLALSNQNGLTVSFNYDNQGNRTGITYPNGESTNYSFDSFNRIQDIQNNEGIALANYSYNPNGTLSSITRSNNTETLYSYDSAQRLINLVHQISDNPFTNLLYGYDSNSNRIFQSDSVNSGIGDAYHYDDINQLIYTAYGSNNPSQEASTQGSTSINRYTSFNFDPLGNRLSVDQNGTAVHYGPNNGSQLTNVVNQYESVDSATLTYDDNGNLLSDENLTITWDQDNKISSILNNSTGKTTHYKYDALGRRIEKNVDGEITKYLYDNKWNAIEEYNNSNELQRRFIQGYNIDEWIALVDFTSESPNTYFYHSDVLGSIIHLTNSLSQIVEKYKYDVFGKPYIYNSSDELINESALNNHYLFSGRRIDYESYLYYYRFRYYSSSLGRFISNDPLSYVDSMSLYSYVINNPLIHIDPYGLWCVPISSLYGGWKTISGPYNIRWIHTALFSDIAGSLGTVVSKKIADYEQQRFVIPRELCYECNPLTSKKELFIKQLDWTYEFRPIEVLLERREGPAFRWNSSGNNIEGGDVWLGEGPNGESIGGLIN